MSRSAPQPSAPGAHRSWRRGTAAHQAADRQQNLPVVNETSAGGVIISVQNGRAYTAVIARRNRGGRLEWCLPKGHLEGDETAQEAAVREISEETGITGRVLRHLASTDYWFSGYDRRVHKIVHHFLLEALSGELTTENDPDHEAEKVEWVRLDKVASRLAYPNERRIVMTARNILAGRE
ncbi:MAG: NUDIX hydrolase [Actinomycetaceae bacterium]|nr:NUDIX hydrolase [Actinomycetaceae bacterium]